MHTASPGHLNLGMQHFLLVCFPAFPDHNSADDRAQAAEEEGGGLWRCRSLLRDVFETEGVTGERRREVA